MVIITLVKNLHFNFGCSVSAIKALLVKIIYAQYNSVNTLKYCVCFQLLFILNMYRKYFALITFGKRSWWFAKERLIDWPWVDVSWEPAGGIGGGDGITLDNLASFICISFQCHWLPKVLMIFCQRIPITINLHLH